MNTRDDLEFEALDVERRLRGWMAATASVRVPPDLVPGAVERAASVRQRPHFLARAGVGGSWVTFPQLSPHALVLTLVGVLLATFVGGALLMGSQSKWNPANDPTVRTPDGLIMVAPFGDTDEIAVLRPDGQVAGTVGATFDGCPTLVADGKRVALTTWEGPLTIAPLDGSGAHTYPELRTDNRAPTISADGSRSAVVTLRGSDRSDLTIVSLVDGTATVVAHDLMDVSAVALSADGEQVAIGRVSDTTTSIDVIDEDGSNLREITRRPRDLRLPSPVAFELLTWSADGTRLVYNLGSQEVIAGGSPHHKDDARVIEVATGKSTVVANADGTPVDAWMPIRNRAVFLWNSEGRTVVYWDWGRPGISFLDLVTGEIRSLPDQVAAAPAWSPDGSRLAFLTSEASYTGRLTTVRADASDRVDQDVPIRSAQLAWSPDGRQIAVVANDGLYLYGPGGLEQPKRISEGTRSATVGVCLSWSATATP